MKEVKLKLQTASLFIVLNLIYEIYISKSFVRYGTTVLIYQSEKIFS